MKVSHVEVATQLKLTLVAENTEDFESLIKFNKSLENKIPANRFVFTNAPNVKLTPFAKPINLATLSILLNK